MHRTIWLIFVALALPACLAQTHEGVYCFDEGRVQDGKRCVDGVWVGGNNGTTGPNGVTASNNGSIPCVPESDESLCRRHNYNCGAGPLIDNCGEVRELECGACNEGSVCPGEELSQCDCSLTTVVPDCSGLMCGTTSYTDGCGNTASISCGESCTEAERCDTGIDPSTCTCDEVAACEALGAGGGGGKCGVLALDALRCGAETEVTCGCGDNATCDTTTSMCKCDADFVLESGNCVEQRCDPACGANEICDQTYTCVCEEGYVDVSGVCEPVPVTVLVTDVQHISADATPSSMVVALSTAIDAANTVPFMSTRMLGTGDDVRALSLDVSLEDSQITLTRGVTSGGGTVKAEISLVTFDPALVTVQHHTFNMNNSSSDVTITQVDRAHSFLVFYHTHQSGAGLDMAKERQRMFVRGHIASDGNTVRLRREGNSGNVRGNLWVVSSPHFNVEHHNVSMDNATTEVTVPVQRRNDGFVLFSSRTSTDTDLPQPAHVTCEAGSPWKCSRAGSGHDVDLAVQVVSSPTISVQHFTAQLMDASPVSVSIAAPGAKSIVTSGAIGVAGAQRSHFNGSPPSFVAMTFNDARDVVVLTRGSGAAGALMHAAGSVIDWAPTPP